jgi:hypothetical protein
MTFERKAFSPDTDHDQAAGLHDANHQRGVKVSL